MSLGEDGDGLLGLRGRFEDGVMMAGEVAKVKARTANEKFPMELEFEEAGEEEMDFRLEATLISVGYS